MKWQKGMKQGTHFTNFWAILAFHTTETKPNIIQHSVENAASAFSNMTLSVNELGWPIIYK